MKPIEALRVINGVWITLILTLSAITAEAQPTAAERAAMLKATMAASQVVLRQYEWIETTVIRLKDNEKSRKQERCYYGAEGALQKVELNASPAPEKKRGLRGRIIEQKREELTETMKSAVALVKTYVPPAPARIEAAKAAGKVSIEILDPGKRARLNFRDYEKPGDRLGVEVDLQSNRPLAIQVSSYLGEDKDAVTLNVRLGQLTDGTVYPQDIALEVKAKDLVVQVTHSGYRKLN